MLDLGHCSLHHLLKVTNANWVLDLQSHGTSTSLVPLGTTRWPDSCLASYCMHGEWPRIPRWHSLWCQSLHLILVPPTSGWLHELSVTSTGLTQTCGPGLSGGKQLQNLNIMKMAKRLKTSQSCHCHWFLYMILSKISLWHPLTCPCTAWYFLDWKTWNFIHDDSTFPRILILIVWELSNKTCYNIFKNPHPTIGKRCTHAVHTYKVASLMLKTTWLYGFSNLQETSPWSVFWT